MKPIVWTDLAVSDLESLHSYITRDSQRYADHFVERLIASVEQLAKFPEIGRLAPESPADRILVLAIIHGGRDLSQLASKPWEIL